MLLKAQINDSSGKQINELIFDKGKSYLIKINEGHYLSSFLNDIENRSKNISLFLNDIYLDHYQYGNYLQIIRFKINANESAYYYYQQRYYATENDEVPTLNDFIGNEDIERKNFLLKSTLLGKLIDHPINTLSTGEFKIASVIKSILKHTSFIFFEEPFEGLDNENSLLLYNFLNILKSDSAIIVLTSKIRKEFFFDFVIDFSTAGFNENADDISSIPFDFEKPIYNNYEIAFDLKNINVKYNDNIILKDVSWQVKKNEKWALRGPNGAGKTMLLSLIYADHPQSYSNKIYVFDKLRGTGESIWEIKEKIGFYSHEFFRFVDRNKNVEDTIKEIVFSNPYNVGKNHLDINLQERLFDFFNLDKYNKKYLYQLGIVEQKLVLFCGIILKNAPLIILDEPYHYFDEELVRNCNHILNLYCKQRTLLFVSHSNNDYPECINLFYDLE